MIALFVASLALGQLSLKQDAGSLGQVSSVNCMGPNVTCARSGSTWDLSVSAAVSGSHNLLSATHTDTKDAGPVDDTVIVGNGTLWEAKNINTCYSNGAHAAYNATNNAFDCLTNTVAGGSCAAGNYATSLNNQASPTCAQVQTSQIGGAVSDAQLASNYSGIGACAAGSVVSSVNDNGAPTCVSNNAAVGGTCAVGSVVTAVSSTGAVTCAAPISGGSCGAGMYITSISSSGAITCGTPTITGGTCGDGEYVSAIDNRGAVTCKSSCPSGCI